MGHRITESDRFGYVGQRAWHGLGQELPAGLKATEGFREIGLDWKTGLADLVAQTEEGDSLPVSSHRLHYRLDTHTPLGIVSQQYQPVDNMEMAEFADAISGVEEGVEVETAGSLREGRVVFALVRLPHTIEVTDEDILHNYILVRNNHDAGAAFSVHPTSVRVVCANTLRMSERDGSKGIRIWHTGDLKTKLEHARLALGIATQASIHFESKVRLLAAQHLKADQVRQYFRTVYDRTWGVIPDGFERQLRHRDKILTSWEENMEDALKEIRGTAWAAYNAVSQWHDHQRGRYLPVSSSDARVHSNLFGGSARDKQVGFQEAMALV